MLKPDFSSYSLALVKSDEIIFSSAKSGIRPLLECVTSIKEDGCILHDKVIGLAAARLIAYSGIIESVKTMVISRPAKEHLEKNKIPFEANTVTDRILNNSKTGMCPMEEKALKSADDKEFFDEISLLFSS